MTRIRTGRPPVLRLDRATNFTLQKDTTSRYIDQNAHRNPSNPLGPLVRAIDQCSPGFQYHQMDVVTDRKNLRNLLNYAGSLENPRQLCDPFRIDFELAGNTLILQRWNAATEVFEGSYEEAHAAKLLKNEDEASGHHRIVTYVRRPSACRPGPATHADHVQNFDGLKVLLRCQVDGYIPIDSRTPGPTGVVDQESLIKLKMATVWHKTKALRTYGQLVIGQIPFLVVSRHQNGNFTEQLKFRLDEMEMERRTTKPLLAKVATLLERMRAIAEAQPDGAKLSLVAMGNQFWVHARKGGVGLTAEQLVRFSK